MIAFQSLHHSVEPSSPTDSLSPRTSVITSADLLANGKLIHIQHRGELYSLRETRLGKLILTK